MLQPCRLCAEAAGECTSTSLRGDRFVSTRSYTRLRQLKWSLKVIGAALVACWTVSAQQRDSLQEQLQQLKQQYEQTTRDLQQRIAALEQQIEKEKAAGEQARAGTISAAALAAEQAAKKAVLGNSDQVG